MSQGSRKDIRAVAVYCASSIGLHADFAAAASSLGSACARGGITVINGGGSGLMDVVTKSTLAHCGNVIGIAPYAMHMGGGETGKITGAASAPDGLQESRPTDQPCGNVVVDSMHERKIEMATRSDGFIALPGGFGTYEEVCEVITWNQINIHHKPIVILNVRNFYAGLKAQISAGLQWGFIDASCKDVAVFVDGPENPEEHHSFDWGSAALKALSSWDFRGGATHFDWTMRMDNSKSDALASA